MVFITHHLYTHSKREKNSKSICLNCVKCSLKSNIKHLVEKTEEENKQQNMIFLCAEKHANSHTSCFCSNIFHVCLSAYIFKWVGMTGEVRAHVHIRYRAIILCCRNLTKRIVLLVQICSAFLCVFFDSPVVLDSMWNGGRKRNDFTHEFNGRSFEVLIAVHIWFHLAIRIGKSHTFRFI